MPPAQRLLLIFSLAILLPGVVLGLIGLHALVQEELQFDRQIQERLDEAAHAAGLRLESELTEWEEAARQVARSAEEPAAWPVRVRRAIETTGAAVVLTGTPGRPHVYPNGQLLFAPSAGTDDPAPVAPELDEAERLEFRDKRQDQAIALYRRMLPSAKPYERALILRNLAGALRHVGRQGEALELYELLAREPSIRVGSQPSDLLALYEIAAASSGEARAERAVELYRGLVEGRWGLQEETYADYAHRLRDWMPASEDVRRLADQEAQKMSLTRAAQAFVRRPESIITDGDVSAVAFWTDDPFAAVVVRRPFAGEILDGSDARDLTHALVGPGGLVLSGQPTAADSPASTYAIRSAAFPLRLTVSLRDPAATVASVRTQQTFYLGILGIVAALLAFGGYFTVRTLRTELAVAQMKSDFVSTVSHEFRSPLAGISQLAEILRDGRVADDTRRNEYYEMIAAETSRLRRLVENVLDFSRMEDGRKQYRFEPLEPAVWLRELTEDFQAQIAASGFQVETSIPSTLPTIVADRETLTTAVQNLLDNAVKYSPTIKRISIAAVSDDDTVSISVSDRGVGIAEEDRPRIFEKFYRGGGRLARQVKGVGLGLNLVHHIVGAHGGTIAVDSTEGVGTTFTIRLHHDAHPAG
jgi:signal transduction histidine kinase